MTYRLTLPLIAFSLLASACAPADPEAAAETRTGDQDVVEELDRRWASFEETLMLGDAEAFMDYWAADLRVLEPGMDTDRAGFEEAIRDFWDGGEVIELDLQPLERWVHGDAAYELGQYDETFRESPDGEPATIRNYYFIRWERGEDGAWRIARFLAAPREAPAAD